MSRYENLVTEKSAGAGIAARLTEQRHRGPGSAAHAAEHGALVGPVAKIVSEKKRRRHEPNKTEAAWKNYLNSTNRMNHIHFEGVKFALADGAWYTPDFVTVDGTDGTITAWEVKGFWREASRVRIKVAASRYPWITFIAVQKKRDGWHTEVI